VPLALFGAVIFMFLKMPFGKFFTDGWTTSFNIYSQVGLVTLVGLISKNGILIVQFANEQQRQGLSKLAAVAEAARLRLRPIMMTTLAALFGAIPLAVERLRTAVDLMLRVSEHAIAEALVACHDAGVEIEPSAAAAVAAVPQLPAGGPVVLVLTGRNLDPAVLDRARRDGPTGQENRQESLHTAA